MWWILLKSADVLLGLDGTRVENYTYYLIRHGTDCGTSMAMTVPLSRNVCLRPRSFVSSWPAALKLYNGMRRAEGMRHTGAFSIT